MGFKFYSRQDHLGITRSIDSSLNLVPGPFQPVLLCMGLRPEAGVGPSTMDESCPATAHGKEDSSSTLSWEGEFDIYCQYIVALREL